MKPRFVDCFLLMGSALSLRGDQSPENNQSTSRDTTKVYVSLTLLNLNFKDLKNMEVQIDFLLHQYWIDPRLSRDERTQKLAVNGQIWEPKLTVTEGTLRENENAQFWRGVPPDGKIVLSSKFTLLTYCTRDFWKMPFDVQYCSIKIGSYRFPNDEIDVSWKKCQIKNKIHNHPEPFSIENLDTYTELDQRPTGNFTVLVARVALRRDTSHFVLCTFTPCTLFTCLSYFTFWLHPRLIYFRLFTICLNFLNLMYFYLHSVCLQTYSGFGYLDIFMWIEITFAVLALCENVAVDYFWNKSDPEKLKNISKLDFIAIFLYPLSNICAKILFFLVVTSD